MTALKITLQVIVVLLSFVLTLLILMHKGKGGTNFGIASTVAGIVQTILWDERRIVPVSTLLDGEYGEHDVFLGVPTELRANGANEIVELDLSEDERAKLHHSAELVREHCEGLL